MDTALATAGGVVGSADAATTAANNNGLSVANSAGDLSSIDSALAGTQQMMQNAILQQERMNRMKMQFDGVMAQLALQASIEEKISTNLERIAQAIAQ